MAIDTFVQKTLAELASGEEINWDYIPQMVEDGKVTQKDALTSLRQGLVEIILPKYREFAQTGDRAYWGRRLAEAETALIAINKGQTVTYRGIEL